MEMFRIVFCGELLEGFQAQDVRKAAQMRFKLDDAQLERMFSGERAILKKAIGAEAGQPYLAELARMGMRGRMESLQPLAAEGNPDIRFKVVFWGRTMPGYTRDQVMRAVPRRLPLDATQVVRLFSGGKAVLKRSVTAEVGSRYIAELARIGMQVELEIEQESLTQAMRSFNMTASQILADEQQSYSGFMQTQIDLQQAGNPLDTNIMGMAAQREAELVPPPIPPKTFEPTTSARPVARAPERSERLASNIEAAYVAEIGRHEAPAAKPETRCTQCGHRQSSGTHCAACGCQLPRRPAQAAAPVKPAVVASADLTHSMRDELNGVRLRNDDATLMREMRQQAPARPPRRAMRLRGPMLVGGAACLAAVGGWLLLSHH